MAEAGLYRLIFKSRKPVAKRFQRPCVSRSPSIPVAHWQI
ncbi:hypothetical protein LC608_23365 [Nostoc sp. XA010]|nr:hypothetical protein [Nostoc sp. XA010]